MDNPTKDSIRVLWATHGSPHALRAIPAIRTWLMPIAHHLDILAVAPTERATVRRLTHWSERQKARDLEEAEGAAAVSRDALGEVGVPVQLHVRWGAASHEIAREANEDRVDVLVMGSGSGDADQKPELSETARLALTDTTRSVFIAREQEGRDGPVIILFNSPRWFAQLKDIMMTLRFPEDVDVCLAAFLPPVRSPGGMLYSFSEHVRKQRQTVHDAQSQILESTLQETANDLSGRDGRNVCVIVADGETAEIAAFAERENARLVIVGDSSLGVSVHSSVNEAAEIAARMPCSVLVAR